MTSITKFAVVFFLLFLVDLPFIYFITRKYDSLWPEKIKFSAKVVLAFIAVYTALSVGILYVALDSVSPIITAFLLGLISYTTYSFTVYGIYSEWPLWLAVTESLWGGVLLTIVTFIIQYVIPRV